MVNQNSILIVEDEPNIAEVVSLYLRRAGYQVQVIADGEKALEAMEQQMPDLLVLDIMLPGIDGLSITRWLRDRSATPIIMLTARRTEAARIAGL
ncbi:MAG: response regulator, partial [Anaerolineales bacterium]